MLPYLLRAQAQSTRCALLSATLLLTLPTIGVRAEDSDHHQHHAAAAAAKITRTADVTVTAPNVPLLSDDGRAFDLSAALQRDEPVFVNFIYTSCTSVCPVQSQIFGSLEGELARRKTPAKLISISIDPAYDTPERLAAYASRFRTGSNWVFLTGSIEASTAVQKAFSVYKPDKMAHDVVTFYRATPSAKWVRMQGFATADELASEHSASRGAAEARAQVQNESSTATGDEHAHHHHH